MPRALTAPSSKTASTQAVQPGQARRPYRHPLWLGLLLGSLTCSGLLYTYLQCGWFESAHLGQVLQIRRMHAEGPLYRVQRLWGVFPRAHRLLHDTFTDNAWTISSTDGEMLYQHLPSWWTVPLSQVPQQVRMAFVLREEQRFYQHAGVDARALLRAIVKTLTGHKQGGSTIAVQVAKHCLLNYGERPTRAWITGGIRKVREMLLAWRLVRRWLVHSAPLISSSRGLVYALHHNSCAMSALSPYAFASASRLASANGLPRPQPLPCRMRSCGMRRLCWWMAAL